MTERQYRLMLGIVLLGCLYFGLPTGCLSVAAVLTLEGTFDWRLTRALCRVRGVPVSGVCAVGSAVQFDFDAERLSRLLVALALLVSQLLYPDRLWWVGWLIGFTLLGAGVSGVCPLLALLRLSGFR